jgi:NAD(P)-dependent dehydrogenase (short-subunit alcohol dehydrogenase family)
MPTGPLITTPFGAQSTAADVIRGTDLTGRRVIVTGGASGIGVETARALWSAGAEVTLAVRDLQAGRAAVALIAGDDNRRALLAHLDLSDPASVGSFVGRWQGPLDILVNNAGVMACPETRTPQGWELQFATNHLGHFALTSGLTAALASAGEARVVSVSSSAHLTSGVLFDDVHFERRPYDPWLAYGQSKTANILFAVEATKQWAHDGVTVNALMPGVIHTNLQRHIDAEELERVRARAGHDAPAWKTPEQGAATTVLVATSALLKGVSGRYFEDCNEAAPNQPGSRRGVAPYALDPDAAARLWALTLSTLAR